MDSAHLKVLVCGLCALCRSRNFDQFTYCAHEGLVIVVWFLWKCRRNKILNSILFYSRRKVLKTKLWIGKRYSIDSRLNKKRIRGCIRLSCSLLIASSGYFPPSHKHIKVTHICHFCLASKNFAAVKYGNNITRPRCQTYVNFPASKTVSDT